jgi:hypothetical protein
MSLVDWARLFIMSLNSAEAELTQAATARSWPFLLFPTVEAFSTSKFQTLQFSKTILMLPIFFEGVGPLSMTGRSWKWPIQFQRGAASGFRVNTLF